ncbi:hypothetical protein [Nonomuraea gerenzanensis]|uniref:Secreted protein n=1 Tax=Nonomuraea gerenzanensis TaxID=93944 RepID=A0A1M4EAZ1_9ACTN|nr:hypothetical protein [Nonomuraea gerenzanensis]SBO95964.1 secreted protein [Nonomuraea gerenzanensis]
MINAWDAVRAAIHAEDLTAIATLLGGFDDAQRREVAQELPGYLTPAQQAGDRRDAEHRAAERARWWELVAEAKQAGRSVWELPEALALSSRPFRGTRWVEAMRVAGAGAIAGAAAVAAWLNRRELVRGGAVRGVDDVPPILQVVASRPVAWQEDLAVRLALRLRGARLRADDGRVRLALALLRATGAEPPGHDPLTLAWITATPVAELAADPLLDAMSQRLFETEGVGRLLRHDRVWGPALVRLAADGRIKRAALLDGCRTRMLRGGQTADLRFFQALHDLLDPAPEEVAPHARDYAALLSLPAANVADLALRRLRQVKAAPPAEAVESLLFRSEGRLVRAGLALLDRVLKQPGEDVDAYAPALAAALLSGSGEARDRAVRLAVKHAGRFGPEAARTIRETVAMLPPGPAAELAGVFGGEAAPPPPPRPRYQPPPLPPAPEPGPMPLITDAGVLARISLREYDWMQPERWLDGFVRLAAGEQRESLIAELAPLAARFADDRYHWMPWWDTNDWAGAMARELIEPRAERRAMPDCRADVARRVPPPAHSGVWRHMPLARFGEVYQAQLDGRLPPYLLAVPTRANGLLDAEALVERLEGYERDGVHALPLDLRQALLRLGRRTVTAEAVRRAAQLTGPAGRRVHRWLTDRPAHPEVVLRWTTHEDDTRIAAEFDWGQEYEELFADLLAPRMHDEPGELLLPVFAGHRELAAARLVYGMRSFWPISKPTARDLDHLVLADGPGGPGVALLFARYLMEGADGDGVRPFLHLAASGDLPGAELGRQLAFLLRRGQERPAGAIGALEEAARLGAHREVWQVMTGLLPAYLPGAGERATGVHTRLMRVAAEVAEWADARGELPVVAELAGRGRTSELVRQARALHALLTSPA